MDYLHITMLSGDFMTSSERLEEGLKGGRVASWSGAGGKRMIVEPGKMVGVVMCRCINLFRFFMDNAGWSA